ncbi:MAG: hypothetical protein HRU21_01570 [Pseudomonadales bacterium]|nr:hypothetical protein [Pseudomonadales bacterium]
MTSPLNKLLLVCLLITHYAWADAEGAYDSQRADSHAPISVMGDHTHSKGEWMVSYRFMQMQMDGLRSGGSELSRDEFFASEFCQNGCNYAEEMSMDMHMLGVMYAPSDQITLMAMLNYHVNDMQMLMKMPMSGGMGGMGGMGSMNSMMMNGPMLMEMESEGLGDVKLGALQSLYKDEHSRFHANWIVSLPTGSIDQEIDSDNPMTDGKRLAYGMQLGSGSFDFEPALTYVQQYPAFSWGAQAKAIFRLNENKHDYRLGDKYQAQAWFQVPFLQRFSASLRLAWQDIGEIRGQDDEIESLSMKNPLANGDNFGGSMTSAGFGVNAVLPAGNRLALEYVTVLDQNSNGIQMTMDDYASFGWQFAF